MKKIGLFLFIGVFVCLGLQVNAQENANNSSVNINNTQEKINRAGTVPADAFNYQAVLRDASGMVLTNEVVEITIDIIEETPTGMVVYTQTETDTTSAQGLLNIVIGNDAELSAIDWRGNKHFIRLTVDGTEMGISELLTVPYAMTAGNVQWGKYSDYTYALSNRVGIGTETPVAQLELSRDDASVNS